MHHTISGLVHSRPGVLYRIAEAFGEYEINIKSIAVSETEVLNTSRMTIVVEGHDAEVRKVTEKLKNLKDVQRIEDLARKEFVDRELALVKVASPPESVAQVSQIAELFGARAVAVGKQTIILEVAGDSEKIDGIIELLMPVGLKAVARTGRIALKRDNEEV